MKQKYISIIIIVVIAAVYGLIALEKKTKETPRSEFETVKVMSPKAGDRWGNGFVHRVQWRYSIQENVTIALCTSKGCEILASEVPNTGEFQWGISAAPGEGYTIEVYPAIARERVGRSGVFTIMQVK